MHDIEMQEASPEFARCWKAAGFHIQGQVQGPLNSWLKVSLNPPFLEHLSFRLGNQLFFICIEDADGKLEVPGSRQGLRSIADGCNGHACLMPMRREGAEWIADGPGWGVLDLRTGRAIDPIALITDDLIEMTNWELQDFAVQIVKDHLAKQGRTLMSWQGNPSVDPSIWFVGDHGPEWVVVRAARYPETSVEPPANWRAIAESCSKLGKSGHFASVGFANRDDAFDPNGAVPATPLWRGHGMLVRFIGLTPGPS
jgi:hypothetical protein